MSNDSSVFERSFDPIYQALIALGGAFLITVLAKLLEVSGAVEVTPRFPWVSSAAFLLIFALFNAVFSVSSVNMAKYWGRSVYSFMGLALLLGLVAWLFSSLSINEAGSYRWIYMVVTVAYLIFLGMMAFMRQVVEFAQREEWNHPRIRKNK